MMLRYLSLVCLLIMCSLVFAGEQRYTVSKRGNQITSSLNSVHRVFEVKDVLYPSVGINFDPLWWRSKGVSVQRSYGLVELDLVEGSGLVGSRFEVEVTVLGYKEDGTKVKERRLLRVDYSNGYNQRTTERFGLRFDGLHQMQVTVERIVVNGLVQSRVTTFPDLELRASIVVDRLFNLGLNADMRLRAKDSASFIVVRWDSFPGAEGYDLEWTVVDRLYNLKADDPLIAVQAAEYGASAVGYNFEGNSTRVRLDYGQLREYRVPALFESAFVLFRVRPVTYRALGSVGVITGSWQGVLPKGKVSDYSPTSAVASSSCTG